MTEYHIKIVVGYDTEAETEKEAIDEARNIINKRISWVGLELENLEAIEIVPECMLCHKSGLELRGGVCKNCLDNFNAEYDAKKGSD